MISNPIHGNAIPAGCWQKLRTLWWGAIEDHAAATATTAGTFQFQIGDGDPRLDEHR